MYAPKQRQLLSRIAHVFLWLAKPLPIRPVHYLLVVALITLFFTAISNMALWRHIFHIIDTGSDSHENMSIYIRIFSWSIPVAIYFLMYAIFLILFSWRYVLKPVFVVLLLTCATATYAAWHYGIIFDSTMITNIVETNPAEATSYLSLSSILTFVVLGVLPSLLLLKIRIYYPRPVRSLLERLTAIAITLILALILIIPFYQQYVFLGRNNTTLQKEILPITYIFYTYRHVKDKYFTTPQPYVAMGNDATKQSTTDKPKLMFLVLGETARAQNFSANDYHRPTNQYTDQKHTIFFDISSCGTYTAHSVPCMFSNLPREEYTEKRAENREGVLDVLRKAGVEITWLENNGGCKGVCDRVKNITIDPNSNKQLCNGDTCFDEIFLSHAAELSKNVTTDTLIAFHLIGSHGPRYYERYPEKFRIYTPDCNRPDVENCNTEELINAYDNTITYTDYVLSKLIEILEEHMDTNDTMLLYVSDHGESLGENNVYLHAAPYAFAPKEQTRVPMQLWMPSGTAEDLKVDVQCLRNISAKSDFSHDNFFHSLLGMMQVHSSEYRPQLDIFTHCPLAEQQTEQPAQ